MQKPLSNIRTFLVLNLVIEMIIFLSGCRAISGDETIQGNIYLTATRTPQLTTFATESVLNTPHLTPSATPIALDPIHWTLFNSPVELLQSDVQHIGQADNGTMWFGGRKIYRYDKGIWTIFDQKNISAFRGRVIVSLTIATNGVLWVGTEMNEIISYDGKDWISQVVGEGGYRENWITSILIRQNGEICAITIEGMSCQNGVKWRHYPITIPDTVNRVHVKDAILTTTDEIWVPVDNGFLYHYDGNIWEHYEISSWICCVATSRDGNLWIFSHEGFGKMEANGNISYVPVPSLISNYITTIRAVNDGTIWIGTGGGYQIVRYVNGAFVTMDEKIIHNLEDEKASLSLDNFPFNHVHYIFQSSDGSIWIGTVGGIFQYK
jgi:ligand-binding sensor domain-containing protein